MDAATSRLVDYAMGTKYSDLPDEVVHECKRRLIDTFACAIGAHDEPLSHMARAVAKRHTGTPAASVWGCSWQSSVDVAAFANGVMLRYLDMSDQYRVKSGGHPSDVIAPVLAVGDALRADGASIINAVTLAYQVYCSLCDAYNINIKGWDHPVNGVIAAALAVGKLLGLTREQMGHAVSLALAPNMALAQTRHGELSSWKGCAGANASRNGVFAAFLAQDGFTGPTAVFEGKAGLWDIVGSFDWPISPGDVPYRIAKTHLKCFPVCYHGQSPVWAALELRGRIEVHQVDEICVETYRVAAEGMGKDPSRWAPRTRETADHSMPYVIAVALLDGEVTSESFSDKRLADPVIADLMRKIKVNESPELSARYPESAPCHLTVRTTTGSVVQTELRYPKGHDKNPMNDKDVETKFQTLFRGYCDEDQCRTVLQALWGFERVKDIRKILELLVPQSASGAGSRVALAVKRD